MLIALWLVYLQSALLYLWAAVCKTISLCYRTVVCPVCLSRTLVYCGQTIVWIKMPLGTEVGLCPGDIVLDGDLAAPNRRKRYNGPPPTFRPSLLWHGAHLSKC